MGLCWLPLLLLVACITHAVHRRALLFQRTPSPSENQELKDVLQKLDNDVQLSESEPTFLRQIRKYSRRLWLINCSARRRRLCHCYSRPLREYFCCDCDSGPCFPASALVSTPDGATLTMGNLSVGHTVIADEEGGLSPSRVLGFLDRRPKERAIYLTLHTRSGRKVTLSGNHLIFVTKEDDSSGAPEAVAASLVHPGQKLLTLKPSCHLDNCTLTSDPVVVITRAVRLGAFVPLTEHGTLVVGGALVSCYASFPHDLAHAALTPARLAPSLLLDSENSVHQNGVRTLPKILKTLGKALLPSSVFFQQHPHDQVFKFDLRN